MAMALTALQKKKLFPPANKRNVIASRDNVLIQVFENAAGSISTNEAGYFHTSNGKVAAIGKFTGSYKAVFNGSNFASGVYYYRIEAGNFTAVKKMMMVK